MAAKIHVGAILLFTVPGKDRGQVGQISMHMAGLTDPEKTKHMQAITGQKGRNCLTSLHLDAGAGDREISRK
jgi:hypothetical protein